MAEEFLQAGICGGTWWMMNPSKGMFGGCSSPIGDVGSFGWGADVVDIKQSSACEESNITSVSDSSMAFPSCQKPDSDSSGGDNVFIDSTLPIMGFGLSSSTTSDWNPSLLRANGRAEKYYNSTIHEEMNPRLNCHQETVMDSSQINKDWSPGDNYSSTTDFLLDQPRMNSITSSGSRTTGFPVDSASSVLLQSLFEPDHPQPQQQLFNNQSMNYMSNDQLSPSWPKLQPSLFRTSSPKQQLAAAAGGLQFSNNTTFWNTATAALNNGRTNFLPSSQPQFLVPTFEEKLSCSTLTTKTEEVRELGMMKKGRTEPAIKRPRIEPPPPLTTFKVRKEKLGDRITALQQLVSPFGKTDTASVLHEAIEYIKFLHDQVNALSTPYMKQASPIQHQQSTEKLKDLEQDLRSRGLCLVPISSTFPVANETTADFWTLTFGGLSGR
ncbi:hypothetical protein SLE2022_014350 [Rubroshorea leprosula]